MHLRFSPNLSILFKEVPFLERFERAARAGFQAVEFWWPRDEDLDAVEAAARDSGVEVILFNLDAGDMTAGERGLLSDPERQSEFEANLPLALDLAQRLGCRQLNALLGLQLPSMSLTDQLTIAVANLRAAAHAAREVDATVLIEAINTFDNGPYLVSRTEDAARLAARVGAPNIALQYDVYHMQRMEGNLTQNLRSYIDVIGHIQVADAPGRGEPGTGELNFAHLFDVLSTLGYRGHIGLEYIPSTQRTEASFSWIPAAITA